jgi:hypothetical protein
MKEQKSNSKKPMLKKEKKFNYKKFLLEERNARILKYGASLDDCLDLLAKLKEKAAKKNSKVEQEIIGKMEYYIREIEFEENKHRNEM